MSAVMQAADDMPPWHEVGALEALFAERACHGVTIDGRRIGLFLVDGAVHAIDDMCTHGNALLSDGELEGHEIECPLHAGLFDVRNGRAMCAPLTRDAAAHDVRVETGKVFVRVGSGA
ncbi:ferredoxin subunit of nitrite reductase and ring-hydroxylating dioxygenase [Burkholderia sp. Ch1-1]|jgi:naphthalene 1,2-dioxygenase ferredoxin component|uniref:Naphthalene 1,2-dioxygenase system, ferredoxin component n=1 Tax=Paraburkholderia dioscoreae TaxID=2604047 RepID=A0A5Q4YU80_9BURK|nr:MULTISPECIES: non-heme iron oxygenase ferredoxin subunit [Paraburkholderia]EIF28847.1 ferredoxin subunit of nitrite reductase and ring-hydroxylating dioxygenase [Burkholderia sp. Ch1-1]MDR8400702.1 non-heme iron oxygenase ferredoxin subunit [Paraburkholderia sp. USG1]VVD26688.1 Naphthalene 1,2-dioxygenase system, ferredoxin component [Paraburkholderia dioscoreae]